MTSDDSVIAAPAHWRPGPAANAVIGVLGTSLGAAAASATLPVIVPLAIAGGLAAYLLTNRIPKE